MTEERRYMTRAVTAGESYRRSIAEQIRRNQEKSIPKRRKEHNPPNTAAPLPSSAKSRNGKRQRLTPTEPHAILQALELIISEGFLSKRECQATLGGKVCKAWRKTWLDAMFTLPEHAQWDVAPIQVYCTMNATVTTVPFAKRPPPRFLAAKEEPQLQREDICGHGAHHKGLPSWVRDPSLLTSYNFLRCIFEKVQKLSTNSSNHKQTQTKKHILKASDFEVAQVLVWQHATVPVMGGITISLSKKKDAMNMWIYGADMSGGWMCVLNPDLTLKHGVEKWEGYDGKPLWCGGLEENSST